VVGEPVTATVATVGIVAKLGSVVAALGKIAAIGAFFKGVFGGIKNWLSGGKKREEELKANKLNAVKEFMDKHGPNLMKTLEDINVSDMLGGRDLKEAWTIYSSGKGGVWQWMYPGLVSPALEAKRDQTTAENGYDKAVADMAYWWTVVKYLWNAMSSHYASSNYHDAYFVMATLVGNKDLDIEAYNRNGGASVWGWNAISNFGVAVERLTGLYKKILEQKAAQRQAEIAKQTAKRKQDTVAGLSVAGVALLGGLTGLYLWKKRKKGVGAMKAQKGKAKVFEFPAQYRKVAGRLR
jgi:LPXTG-motif cell wall-anchored protein